MCCWALLMIDEESVTDSALKCFATALEIITVGTQAIVHCKCELESLSTARDSLIHQSVASMFTFLFCLYFIMIQMIHHVSYVKCF